MDTTKIVLLQIILWTDLTALITEVLNDLQIRKENLKGGLDNKYSLIQAISVTQDTIEKIGP